MHITVVGAGYVGLMTAACFSDFGVNVTCVDKSAEKIEALRSGIIPIYEPGLETLVKKMVLIGRQGDGRRTVVEGQRTPIEA